MHFSLSLKKEKINARKNYRNLCLIEDLLISLNHSQDRQCQRSYAEVVTTAIVAAMEFRGNCHHPGLFSNRTAAYHRYEAKIGSIAVDIEPEVELGGVGSNYFTIRTSV